MLNAVPGFFQKKNKKKMFLENFPYRLWLTANETGDSRAPLQLGAPRRAHSSLTDFCTQAQKGKKSEIIGRLELCRQGIVEEETRGKYKHK